MGCLIREYKNQAIPLFVTSFLWVSYTSTQFFFFVTNFSSQCAFLKAVFQVPKYGFRNPKQSIYYLYVSGLSSLLNRSYSIYLQVSLAHKNFKPFLLHFSNESKTLLFTRRTNNAEKSNLIALINFS